MAKQLGALVSLLQGIDMSPLQNARQNSLAQGQLALAQRAQEAEQVLETRRLDLAKMNAADNLSLDKERLGLARTELTSREKQAEEQRTLDRQLAEMQQAGRVDLQELIGAQELAGINLQGQLSQTLQQDRMAFEEAAQDRLLKAQGANLDKELNLRRSLADREFELAKRRGDDDAAMAVLEREGAALRNKMLKLQEEKIPGDVEYEQSARAVELELARLSLRKSRYELEKINPDSPTVKKLQELELSLAEATVEKTQQEARQEKQIGDLQEVQVAKFKEKGKSEDTEAGYLDPKLAAEGKVPRGAVKFFTGEESDIYAADLRRQEKGQGGDGLDARIEAFKELEALGDAQDEESVAIRKALRRFLNATNTKGARNIAISFGSVDRQWKLAGARLPGAAITETEEDEIDDALEELSQYDITLGEDLFG
jgi:hypothetical protein